MIQQINKTIWGHIQIKERKHITNNTCWRARLARPGPEAPGIPDRSGPPASICMCIPYIILFVYFVCCIPSLHSYYHYRPNLATMQFFALLFVACMSFFAAEWVQYNSEALARKFLDVNVDRPGMRKAADHISFATGKATMMGIAVMSQRKIS